MANGARTVRNPLGYADNTYVLHYRLSSEGRGMYRDNAR